MSEGLLTQWRDRVVEAETEISVVQEDITALVKQRKEIKQDIGRYDKLVQREKQEMLKRLEEVEGQAEELEGKCQKTLQNKTQVEELYVKTLDNYESMHAIVKEIQMDEQQLQQREDFEAKLQEESLLWAEEEHGLRTRLNTLQSSLKKQRKQYQEEITALETELAAAERQLQKVQSERQGDIQQQQEQQQQLLLHIQGGKHSRRGTPIPTAQNSFSTTRDANHKEQEFISANASSSVPTRQLRSCLKNSNNSTSNGNHTLDTKNQLGCNSNNNKINNIYSGGLSASQCQSAPVSRATSQALVAGESNGLILPSGLTTPHRAYSYAAGKKAGNRKREVLGDSTNF
ncbi:uncharacterized protein TM35_000271630 [Trypanosoma theileri]|uniref:Uncharacterized protein n=1 Tax=Trypanosoma theileri TaxID=67003 RepID=A0A1X0NQ36_9TRYP|nr:uncharacterized protein TM35_000271630 [Trypanosoma theileri]ORC86573.1 hypothetical protein TM35_000271630 [Trypanosoma theileri]